MDDTLIFLGLGSNLGNRKDYLDQALDLLSQRMEIRKISSVYETKPVGNTDQPRFLNLVCEIKTPLSPQGILTIGKGIESKLGRSPGYEVNSPRTIDIDILMYGDMVLDTDKLNIPHPRLAERAFVLVPFAEIAPDMMHPVEKKTIGALLDECKGRQGVSLWHDEEGET